MTSKFDAQEEASRLMRSGVTDNYVTDGRTGMSHHQRADALADALQRAYDRGVEDGRRAERERYLGGTSR